MELGRGVDGVERGAVGSEDEDSGLEGFPVETDSVDLDLGSVGPHRSMSMAQHIRGGKTENGRRESRADGAEHAEEARVGCRRSSRRNHGLGSPGGPGTQGLRDSGTSVGYSSRHRQLTCRGRAAARVGPGCWRPAARKIGMLEREEVVLWGQSSSSARSTRVDVQVQICPSSRDCERWWAGCPAMGWSKALKRR